MSWILCALLAPLFSTITNFIDKYIIGDRIQNPQVISLFMAAMGLLAGSVVWVVNDFTSLPTTEALIVLLAGCLSFVSWVYYFKGLAVEETSIVILLFQISPIFTLILSFLFLSEGISFEQLLGFILILGATTAVSLKNVTSDKINASGKNKFGLSEAFWDINRANLFWAISAVILKFSIDQSSLREVLPYEAWGLGLGGIIFLLGSKKLRTSARRELRSMSLSTIAYLSVSEVFALLSRWVTILAFSLGPIALVDVIVGVQVFYGILIGWFLTHTLPKTFNENISRSGLLVKLLAACVLFFGLLLIS